MKIEELKGMANESAGLIFDADSGKAVGCIQRLDNGKIQVCEHFATNKRFIRTWDGSSFSEWREYEKE